jgi:phospholipase C
VIGRPADHSSRFARGELADPELTERLEARSADQLLRRREFLGRTAALAGLAGMAGVLPTDTLVAEAARRAGRAPLPRPRELPIDTFVVLMMENRSFDHYFGWHPRADGRNEGLAYPSLDRSQSFATHHLGADFQGCGFRDPDHGWIGGRHQYNGGAMDGFYTGNPEGDGSDEYALGYYLKADLGFIPHVAAAYTLYDRWFCSIMASTYPNRHYQLAAQNGGQKRNQLPEISDSGDFGFEWETILDRALAHGLEVGYYVSDIPTPGLYGPRGLAWTRPVSRFYTDAGQGTLPPICFVDPPFLGAANGVSADEHPHGDVRLGQAFMSDVVHAFVESPQYRRGALFINYDEWGGFFDHVPPRHVPDDRANRENLDEDWSLTGFRIPAVAVSPYTRARRRGRVNHMTCTHESILKLISYRFGLGYLTKRHRYASNVGRSFDFSRRDLEPPELPDPVAIAAVECAVGGSGRPKEHDLAQLETSGLLERAGYEVAPVSFESLFRYPDAVRRAFERGG